MRMLSRSNRRVAGMLLSLGPIILFGAPAWADDGPSRPSPPPASAEGAAARPSPAEAEAARDAQRRALVLMILKTSGGPFGFLK